MVIRASFLFTPAHAGRLAAVAFVALLAGSPAVRADAGDWTLEPGRPGAPANTRPAVDGGPSNIGPLKRDQQGRIVPIPRSDARGDENDAKEPGKGATRPHDGPARGSSAPRLPGPNPFLAETGSERERARQAELARRVQAEVDQAVSQCRARSRTGVLAADCEASIGKRLETRDREVRAHELAHFHAGQPYSRAPEYFYVSGPGGRQFAVGGVTPMDSALDPGNPTTALAKLRILRRATLAPAEPSPRDREIAERLQRMIDALERR